MAGDRREQPLGVAERGHDLVPGVSEEAAEPLSQERLVLCDHDAHGSTALSFRTARARSRSRSVPP